MTKYHLYITSAQATTSSGIYYSQVSNRRGVWNSRGGWKKCQKLIVRGVGIAGGGWKNLENLIAGGGEILFFLSFFFDHKNYLL